LQAVLETHQYIADRARRYREKNPSATALEEEVKRLFTHHMGMVLGRANRKLFHDVFALTEAYGKTEARFTQSGASYTLLAETVGFLNNKTEYVLSLPEEQCLVIDTALSLARANNAAASLSWLVLSPADRKNAARLDDGEPIWFGTSFTQRAVTLEENMKIELPKDHEVWFGICFAFQR